MKASKPGLREQKQELVRDALYTAAIGLFAEKGFEQTTVEELAQAAGMSRATFFRHFESKDDLLAYRMLSYAATLTEAVRSCDSGSSQLEVVQETALAGAAFTQDSALRTRQVIEISSKSAGARQAYQSRMMQLEEALVGAYAQRFGYRATDSRPRLLAHITGMILNSSIIAWFRGHEPDLRQAVLQAVAELKSIVQGEEPKTLTRKKPASR